MKNTKELFRENLRKLLQRSGMTLPEAAAECGISLSFLNQLLSGKKGYTDETLDKICKGLKCTQADLFFDDSLPNERQAVPSSRSDLILAIQALLTQLSDEDLETIETTAQNLLVLSGRKKSTKAE